MLSKPSAEASGGSVSAIARASNASRSRNRVGVLRAVQACERLRSGVRRARGGRVEVVLESRGHAVEHAALGTRLALGRHQARAQLADDGFPNGGVARHVGAVDGVECEPAGELRLVVAAEAIAIDDLPVRWRGTLTQRNDAADGDGGHGDSGDEPALHSASLDALRDVVGALARAKLDDSEVGEPVLAKRILAHDRLDALRGSRRARG